RGLPGALPPRARSAPRPHGGRGDGARPRLRDVGRPPPRARRKTRRGMVPRLLGEMPAVAGVRVSDLFDLDRPRKVPEGPPPADTPLADRMRPRSLDEVEGPEEVVGSNGFLRRALAEDRIP